MADFLADFDINGRGWVDITDEPGGNVLLGKNIVVQNKSHNAALFWMGANKPAVDSDGYFLGKMGDHQFATVLTKIWVKGTKIHVSETD